VRARRGALTSEGFRRAGSSSRRWAPCSCWAARPGGLRGGARMSRTGRSRSGTRWRRPATARRRRGPNSGTGRGSGA